MTLSLPFLSFLSLSCLMVRSAWAGAWTQPQDQLYFSHATSSYYSESFFDRSGNESAQPAFFKLEEQFYAEYGLSDDLTFGANLFIHYLQQQAFDTINITPTLSLTNQYTLRNVGIGDPEIFARFRLWHNDWNVLSIQPLIKFPSAYYYDRLPKGGSDDYDAEISLLFGHAFKAHGLYHYIDSRIGYRHRFDSGLRDQIKTDISLGLSLTERWRFIPSLSATWSQDLPQQLTFTESGQNDYQLLKLEGRLQYEVRHNMHMYAAVFSHIDGKNAGRGSGITLGTELEF